MEIFGSTRSTIIHGQQNCKKMQLQKIQRLDYSQLSEMKKKKQIRYCHECCVHCFICNEYCETTFECHPMCEDCIFNHVNLLVQDPTWDFKVLCPCHSNIEKKQLPKKVVELISLQKKKIEDQNDILHQKSSLKNILFQNYVEDVLYDKCPHCNLCIYDFDGCCAIKCVCAKYFCALCLHPCMTSREAHLHVAACSYNPKKGDYYLSTSEVKTLKKIQQTQKLWSSFKVVYEKESFPMALAFLKLCKEYGIRFFPSIYSCFFVSLFLTYIIVMFPRVTYCMFRY